MARGIAGHGYEVRVLTAHPHYPEWKLRSGYGQWTRHDSEDGVSITRLRHYIPARPSATRRAISEISFGLRQAFHRWGRPDVIIAVSPALLSTAIARFRAAITHRRVPFIVWVQDLYSLGLSETGQASGLTVRAMLRFEGWVLRHATRVIVIHERFASRVEHDFKIPKERITVVRNWSHVPAPREIDRDTVRHELGWSGHEWIVLHAGNMGVKQGLANVIDAARLAQLDGVPIHFVLLGEGSERMHLENLADGVSTVTFMDPLEADQFSKALQTADVLLVNEKQGVAEMAVPSKLTSYFAAGRPVLAATDPAGITAEEILRARAGIVVPAGNPRSLLEAVLKLTSNPDAAEALGRNGRAFRDSVLTESVAIDAFVELLSDVIDGDDNHPAPRP